jgi:electron transport complex protein RnfG
MKSRIYMVFVLTFVAVVSSGLLAYFAVYTQPYIDKNKKKEIEQAIMEVIPGVKKSEPIINESKFKIFKGFDEKGEVKGYAVYTIGTGFQDMITLMFGIDKDLKTLFSLKVLDQKETPGLGAKITDDTEFLRFWKNKNIEEGIRLAKHLKEMKELKINEVNAISGATISSRAVVKIINDALNKVKKEVK